MKISLKKLLCYLLSLVLVVISLNALVVADDTTVVNSIVVESTVSEPVAGNSLYDAVVYSVNGNTESKDLITVEKCEWYYSDEFSNNPVDYQKYSLNVFLGGYAYDLFITLKKAENVEIAEDCVLVLKTPTGELYGQLYPSASSYYDIAYDVFFDITAQPEIKVSTTGYAVDKDISTMSFGINSSIVSLYNDIYGDGYAVLLDDAGKTGSYLESGTFFEDEDYWLGMCFTSLGDYPLSELSAENFLFEGGCEHIEVEYNSAKDKLFVYFKLNRFLAPEPINFSLEGYQINALVNDIKVTEDGEMVHIIGDGYKTSYAIMYDNNGQPGDLISEEVFAENTGYWLGVAITGESEYDLSRLFYKDLTLSCGSEETTTEFVKSKNTLYVYFKLPQLIKKTIESASFTLNGFEIGKDIVDLTVSYDGDGLEFDGNTYYDRYWIYNDVNGVPADIPLAEGQFEEGKKYWFKVYMVPGDGFDISKMKADALSVTPEALITNVYYDSINDVANVLFLLPELEAAIPEPTETPVITETPEPTATPTPEPTETPVITETPEPTGSVIKYGDVNNDGIINASDALLVLKYAAKITSLTAEEVIVGNVSGDDKLDASDALWILKYAANITETFPIEEINN